MKETFDIAERALQEAKTNQTIARGKLDQLELPKDAQALEDCLSRAIEQGRIEERLANAETERAAAFEQAEVDLAALELWSGDLRALEELPIPTLETMRRFESDLSTVDGQMAEIEKEGRRLHQQLKELQKDLSALIQLRQLPSLEDLIAQRTLRDRGWRSVRNVWLEGGEADQEFLATMPVGLDLASAYEKAVAIADETSDTLRKDAEDVTRAQTLKSTILELTAGLEENQAQLKGQGERRAVLLESWNQIWASLSIAPRSPREMQVWAEKVGEIRREAADCRSKKMLADKLNADIKRITAEVTVILSDLGISVPGNIGFAALLEKAKHIKKNNSELMETRHALEKRLEACEQEIRDNRYRKDQAEKDLQSWSQEWAQAINKLGIDVGKYPDEVNDFILNLDEVFNELDKVREKQQRIAGIKHNYEEYTKRVQDALERLAPELKEMETTEAVIELESRLVRDTNQHKDWKFYEDERRKKSTLLSNTRQDLAKLVEELRLLCVDAQTENPDELPEIERQAAAKSKRLTELGAINEHLADSSSGQDLKLFVEQVRVHDPDELFARIERLTAQQTNLYEEQKHNVENIAIQKRELESFGGKSVAAGIAESMEGLVGTVQTDVEHYIILRMASLILGKAIERYRQINQSPVLEAASRYFAAITGHSFEGLKADYNENGDPVIKAVRPDGKQLMIHEMSDGSRDQLFLSLRMGGLEKYVHTNGPMPFIVDDVLVHFDDERSAAALQALGSLSERTQILFFTHHQHLVELAKTHVQAERLKVHYF